MSAYVAYKALVNAGDRDLEHRATRANVANFFRPKPPLVHYQNLMANEATVHQLLTKHSRTQQNVQRGQAKRIEKHTARLRARGFEGSSDQLQFAATVETVSEEIGIMQDLDLRKRDRQTLLFHEALRERDRKSVQQRALDEALKSRALENMREKTSEKARAGNAGPAKETWRRNNKENALASIGTSGAHSSQKPGSGHARAMSSSVRSNMAAIGSVTIIDKILRLVGDSCPHPLFKNRCPADLPTPPIESCH